MKLICHKTCKELSKSAFHFGMRESYITGLTTYVRAYGDNAKKGGQLIMVSSGGGQCLEPWSPGAPEILAVPPGAQSLLNNDSD